MKDFTLPADDYRVLLEMILLARTVVDYHQGENREEWKEAVHRLTRKILRQAARYRCDDLIEKDEEGNLVPAADYEENSFYGECLDGAADHFFWQELVARLTDRDLARSHTEDDWEMMSAAEQDRRRQERDEFFWQEFENHGIDRLELVPREPHG